MSRPIFIDLTELLAKTGGPNQYYGIARVVAEVAAQMVLRGDDVRFVVFNLADRKFYQVSPRIDPTLELGVDLGVPAVKLRHVRTMRLGDTVLLRDRLAPLAFFLATRHNRRLDGDLRTLPVVNLDGGILYSASRPKLIVEMIDAAESAGAQVGWNILYHDMMPLHDYRTAEHPPRFQSHYINDSRYIFTRAERIIGNSQFTCDDITGFANEGMVPHPNALVSVPLVHECPAGTGDASIDLPPSPYFLSVGALLGRKNLELSIAAMKRLLASGRDMPRLVLAGRKRKRLQTYLAQPENQDIQPYILQIEDPSQVDLNRLYKGAEAVLMPSRMEGWGLPAGEGLWHGTPVLAADIPVLHEVCGDLGWYFDPDDADQLAGYMARLLDDQGARDDLRTRIGAAHGGLRRWSDVASDLISIFRDQA